MKNSIGKVRLVSALCISFFCALSSYAQNSDTVEFQPLSEKTLRQFIPVLKAAIAQKKQNNSASLSWMGTVDEFFAEKALHFGRVTEEGADPLTEVKEMSLQLAFPAGLKYYPETSREASRMTIPNMNLLLVFSYGIELPPLSAKIVRNGEENPTLNWTTDIGLAMEETDACRKINDTATLKAQKFYTSLKYTPLNTAAGTFWVSPDTVLTVQVIGSNFFSPLRKLSGEALPTGPILVISTETKTKASEQLDQASFAGALQKSGLTQTAYDNLLFTLTTAYSDVRDEYRLVNPLPATIPGLPEKEAKEYAATLLEYEANSGFAVRRANLPLYKKFAADLDILIEEYDSLTR